MISYDQIFVEMERQLKAARQQTNEREMRESLAAIRSLCEVVLGGETKKIEQVVPKFLETTPIQSLTSLEEQPLQEEGANGKSLFDF